MQERHTMLKIGAFARLGRVSVVTLRYYDQYGLLKPVMLDPESGYRYYSLDQLPRLNRILALKELGFPLEQIAQLLEEHLSTEQLYGLFKLKQVQTQAMIEMEQARLASIAARLRQIEQEGKMPGHDILLKQVEALPIASIRRLTAPGHDYDNDYRKIAMYLEQRQIQYTKPFLLLLHSRHKMYDEGMFIDTEAAVPLVASLPTTPTDDEQIALRLLPGALVASTVHTGNDLSLGQAYVSFYRWLESNGYSVIGPPRQFRLLHTEGIHPDQYVTEVQFPIAKN